MSYAIRWKLQGLVDYCVQLEVSLLGYSESKSMQISEQASKEPYRIIPNIMDESDIDRSLRADTMPIDILNSILRKISSTKVNLMAIRMQNSIPNDVRLLFFGRLLKHNACILFLVVHNHEK